MKFTLPTNSLETPQISAMAKKRVLVIDDEPGMRIVVQLCLEDIAGWDVILAQSGQEGLIKARTERPDAIVLDVMMPEMDGLTFLKELRANPDLPRIPVILLTAKVTLTQPQRFAELGVAGAISKPFDPLLVSDQIATFLGWNTRGGDESSRE
jgi:CheY-like chemotaxis protein